MASISRFGFLLVKSFILWNTIFQVTFKRCQADRSTELDITGAGLCLPKRFNCQCGNPGYTFPIEVKQCIKFHRWKPKCKPCDGFKEEEICPQFSQCQECNSGELNRCISCPPGKYGPWCNGGCSCQNGGGCNLENGSCNCLTGYAGKNCEIRQANECDPPESITNVIWHGTSNKTNDVVSATCTEGYALIGNKTRTCLSDGTWSSSSVRCEPTCPFPNLNGNVQTSVNPGLPSKLLDAESKEVIKEIEFSCKTGFSLQGPQRIQCLSAGKWDQQPPTCVSPLMCSEPGALENGNRNVTDSMGGLFVPGTQMYFSCKDGFFLDGPEAITCTVSGQWSSELPKCTAVFGCAPPWVPINGNVEITKAVPTVAGHSAPLRIDPRIGGLNKRSHPVPTPPRLPPGYSNVNSKALYSCQSIFYHLHGPSTRQCLPNGQWSGKEPTCEVVCGQSTEPKRPTIINGTVSNAGKWPWQVGISFRDLRKSGWSLICGGSLLSETLVVTAAHCVTIRSSNQPQNTSDFRVHLGNQYRFEDLDGPQIVVLGVESIIVHPNYHPKSLDSDIALIRLIQPVKFSNRIQPVCLPDPSDPLWKSNTDPEGTEGIATGWGITEDGRESDILLEVRLPIVAKQRCEEDYRNQSVSVSVTGNMFCAGLAQGGLGICKGDSGGPFVVERKSGSHIKWVLEGVISWGGSKLCAAAQQYGGFLKVVNFIEWIKQFL